MLKLLIFDIDGTLLPFKAIKPSQRTIKTLNSLRPKYKLVCATGRHMLEIDCVKDIQFDAYVTSDGKVVDLDGHKFIKHLNHDDVVKIVEFVKDHDLACVFTEVNDRYINKVNERVEEYHKHIAFDVPRVVDIEYVLDHEVISATIFEDDGVIEELMSSLNHAKYTRWNSYGADISDSSGGKDLGVKEVMHYYHCDKDEVLCFGDGNNDVSMFKCCGHSCAMGNARQNLKDVAEYVSTNVRRSGLINGLKHFDILKEE